MTMTNNISSSNKTNLDSGQIAALGASAILFLLGIGIAVVKIIESKNKPKDLSKERIYLIGDSLAVGLASQLKILAKNTKTDFSDSSIGGTTIRQWSVGTVTKQWNLKQKINDTIEFKPTIVLILLGTNDAAGIDAYGDQVENTIDQDIQRLIDKLSVTKAQIIWIMPPNITKFKSMSSIRYHILKSNVKTIHSQLMDVELNSDGIHPTGRGYKSWAENIWKVLAE